MAADAEVVIEAVSDRAHKLARLGYSMLKYGSEYVDADQQEYENRY